MFPVLVNNFLQLTVFAVAIAVLAVAYYTFTKPGEVLSFVGKAINDMYARLFSNTKITPAIIAARVGKTEAEYLQAVTHALTTNDQTQLNQFCISFKISELIGTGLIDIYYKGCKIAITSVLTEQVFTSEYLFENRLDKYQWVLKPILTCERCIAGQMALWLYLLIMPFNFLGWLYVIALSALLATFIYKKLTY